MFVILKRKKKLIVASVFLIIYCSFCTLYLFLFCGQSAEPEDEELGSDTLLFEWKALEEPNNLGHDNATVNIWEDQKTNRLSEKESCEERPVSLVGRLNVSSRARARDVYNKVSLGLLEPGGFYSPSQCRPTESVAIIIPYRGRRSSLQTLLFHLHTFLQRQQLEYAIFVIEMAYPTQFNRGLLANVGFLTAQTAHNFTCYVIHDVDLLPADDRNLYRCSKTPRHLSVNSSKYGYRLPYVNYFGGVVAFTPAQYKKVHGFSNAYFGWGKEDDDLYKRLTNVGYTVDRPDPSIGVYEEIPHSADFSNPDNPMKDGLHARAVKRMHREGLNNVLFSRLAVEYRPMYTWVYVSTSETLVMKIVYAKDPELKAMFANPRQDR